MICIPDLLLKPKTDIQRSDEIFGRNALSWSVYNYHIDCALLLIKHSININHSDKESKTVLMYICELYHPRMRDLFDTVLAHKELDIMKVDEDGWTALHWSSVNGHEQLVRKILSKFSCNLPLLDLCDKFGRNALMLAANRGHMLVLRELIYTKC